MDLAKKTQIMPEWVYDQHKKKHFLVKENEKFEKYFRQQKLCESEEEFQKCLHFMRQELPQSFRLNSARNCIGKMETFLRKFPDLVQKKTWGQNVWQCNQSRWKIKEDQNCQKLFDFIVNERKCGNLSR